MLQMGDKQNITHNSQHKTYRGKHN